MSSQECSGSDEREGRRLPADIEDSTDERERRRLPADIEDSTPTLRQIIQGFSSHKKSEWKGVQVNLVHHYLYFSFSLSLSLPIFLNQLEDFLSAQAAILNNSSIYYLFTSLFFPNCDFSSYASLTTHSFH